MDRLVSPEKMEFPAHREKRGLRETRDCREKMAIQEILEGRERMATLEKKESVPSIVQPMEEFSSKMEQDDNYLFVHTTNKLYQDQGIFRILWCFQETS